MLLEPWKSFDMLKKLLWWVLEVVFETWLHSRIGPDTFVGWPNVGIFTIPLSSRGQLYVTVPPPWSDFEQLRAPAVLRLPIFAYNSSTILGAAHIDAEIWNLASYEMCALVLFVFRKCSCSGVVNRFVHIKSL